MAREAIISGAVIVEVRKDEYAELVSICERVAIVDRLVNSNSYVSTEDILTVLGIEKKAKTTTENTH